MRDMLLDAKIQFEQEESKEGENFYILRLEFGKKNILTLVRSNFEELLDEVPGFIKHSIRMNTEKLNQKVGIEN